MSTSIISLARREPPGSSKLGSSHAVNVAKRNDDNAACCVSRVDHHNNCRSTCDNQAGSVTCDSMLVVANMHQNNNHHEQQRCLCSTVSLLSPKRPLPSALGNPIVANKVLLSSSSNHNNAQSNGLSSVLEDVVLAGNTPIDATAKENSPHVQ